MTHSTEGVCAFVTSSNAVEIPQAFRCPITSALMWHPVIADDGCTYEKKAFCQRRKITHISLMTGMRISDNLVVNTKLVSQIDEFFQKHSIGEVTQKSIWASQKFYDLIESRLEVEDSSAVWVKKANDLLADGADINFLGETDTPLLCRAIYCCDIVLAKWFLMKGANVNLCDVHGMTPLHYAANGSYIELMIKLINVGANVNAENDKNMTPLEYVINNGILGKHIDIEVCSMLINNGARLGKPGLLCKVIQSFDERKETDCSAMVQMLINAGADISTKDDHGFTPLWYAVNKDFSKTVQLLLEAGSCRNVDLETLLNSHPLDKMLLADKQFQFVE